MMSLASILRMIVGYVAVDESLRALFHRYVRPELLNDLHGKRIMQGLIKQVSGKAEIDPDAFADDMLDVLMGMGEGNPEEYRDKVVSPMAAGARVGLAKHFPELGLEGARAVVDPKGELTHEQRNKMHQYGALVSKFIGGQLYSFLALKARDWLDKHKRSPSYEKMVEEGEEKEQESEMTPIDVQEAEPDVEPHGERIPEGVSSGTEGVSDLQKMRRDKSKVREIKHWIGTLPEPKSKVYMAILNGRWLAESPRTLKQVGSEVGISEATVMRHERQMLDDLKGQFHGKVEKKEDVEVPSYKTVLSDPAQSASFKKYLEVKEPARGRKSEIPEKIMGLLAEGKASKEVAKALNVDVENVWKVKKRQFDPQYDAWYQEEHEKVASIIRHIARRMRHAA